MKIAILGRVGELCRAELESLSSSECEHLTDNISLIGDRQELDIAYLGGVVKLAQVIYDGEQTSANDIQDTVTNFLRQKNLTHKVSFGLSLYGDVRALQKQSSSKLGINIKKHLVKNGMSARFVPAKNRQFLSAAQVLFNNLAGQDDKGFDFVCLLFKKRLIIGTTMAVQDILSYSKRDYERPCRDMVVGMLPPKLAQILINLARPNPGQVVCDPFCGSGVVLQEALLAGHQVCGSDISSKMIDCSQKNLTWLAENYQINQPFKLSVQDATQLTDLPPNCVIVSEGYLGEPLDKLPASKTHQAQINKLEALYLSFLGNLAKLANSPERIAICLPVWQSDGNIITLNIIDQIVKMGYTLEQFAGADSKKMIYLRPKQIVGRQVLALKRKV